MDTDYANSLALLANTPAQAKSNYIAYGKKQLVLVSISKQIKQSACVLKQKGAISALSGKLLKLDFTYLNSNISSIESDINIYLAKT